jgi:hypothetical protein
MNVTYLGIVFCVFVLHRIFLQCHFSGSTKWSVRIIAILLDNAMKQVGSYTPTPFQGVGGVEVHLKPVYY